MTPAARLSAAIEVLDRWLAGHSAEQALTNWGRSSRFAGSGDRLAVRDLVFGAIRCRRSFAALGGADTGRGLILGSFIAQGVDPSPLFTGEGHAPKPVEPGEVPPPADLPEAVRLDVPDWLAPRLQNALGPDNAANMAVMQTRAGVHLRVNASKTTRDAAQAALLAEGVETTPHALASTALMVQSNPRKVAQSAAYLTGLVELQDAASQAVIEAIPAFKDMKVLDYCAGGGGKALALAARLGGPVWVHDANPNRMRDLPPRAARAGANLVAVPTGQLPQAGPFDLVVTDVPCSGSGSWRRAPEGKWALTPEKLATLLATQAEILNDVARLLAPSGRIAYVTCSLLTEENEDQIARFLATNPAFRQLEHRRFAPLDGGDGFFLSILKREV